MKLKALLCDFDGTLVTKDILDIVCGIVGKEDESKKLNKDFFEGKISGRESLIKRINLIQGVSIDQISQVLSKKDYLRKGAKELFDYLNSNNILTVLYSGNLIPILKYYQNKLGITHIVGTQPKMDRNKILSISNEDFTSKNHKLDGIKNILKDNKISSDEVVAIGDSPADIPIFEFAAKSIAINPKEDIENHTDYVIKDDLSKVIDTIENLQI